MRGAINEDLLDVGARYLSIVELESESINDISHSQLDMVVLLQRSSCHKRREVSTRQPRM